jgi:hypothetical protein
MASKPKSKETYVALYSWVGNDYGVAEGLRLRGDHELVANFPERFVPEDTPDDELERLRKAAAAPLPQPEPLGRVRLRVLPGLGAEAGLDHFGAGEAQTVSQGGTIYHVGDEFEAEGADAQAMIDCGAAEIVKRLPAKKQKQEPEPVQASGITTFPTGREAA